MKSKQRVYVYCESESLDTGVKFAERHFGDSSKFVVVPTNDTELLSHCSFCRRMECPSTTGRQNDIGCKKWIGPGSPILALKTTMWKKIESAIGSIYSLDDVKTKYDE